MFYILYLGSSCAALCKEFLSLWQNHLRNIQLIIDPIFCIKPWCLSMIQYMEDICGTNSIHIIWFSFIYNSLFFWYRQHAGFWAHFGPILWNDINHTLTMSIWPKVYVKRVFYPLDMQLQIPLKTHLFQVLILEFGLI